MEIKKEIERKKERKKRSRRERKKEREIERVREMKRKLTSFELLLLESKSRSLVWQTNRASSLLRVVVTSQTYTPIPTSLPPV